MMLSLRFRPCFADFYTLMLMMLIFFADVDSHSMSLR